MTAIGVRLDNPYWAAVADHVAASQNPWDHGAPEVGGIGDFRRLGNRHELTSRYAWSVTDPATVAFVAEHAGGRVLDPMAGSGYWAWLLAQIGVDVAAFDLRPPVRKDAGNVWHRAGVIHATVQEGDAVDVCRLHGAGRTLLLSWPPYNDSAGARALAAYPGDRVIYIGEGDGGCCGDDDLFAAFERDWREVATHRPVQWFGLHDYVTVYDRAKGAAS